MTPSAAFKPAGRTSTVNLAATTASSRVQVQSAAGGRSLRVHNAGSVTVFIAMGDVTVAAVLATSIPIPPGAVEVITCTYTHVAGITAGGTATLYFTPGDGV